MSEDLKLKNITSKYQQFFENKNDMFSFMLELHKNLEFKSSLSYAKLYEDISILYKDPIPAYQAGKYTPDPINKKDMGENDIFVFGSNTEGRHGAGAAKCAVDDYNAIYGQPKSLQGQSYAIVTKDLSKGDKSVTIDYIEEQVNELIDFAIDNKDKTFWVTKIGCGLGGFTEADIASVFINKILPINLILPKEFVLPQYYMEYLYDNKNKTFYHINVKDKRLTILDTEKLILQSILLDFDNVDNIFKHIPYSVVETTKDEYSTVLEYTLKKII